MGAIKLPQSAMPGGPTPGVRDEPSQARRLGRQEQQAIGAVTGAALQITDVVSDLQFKALQSRIRQETIEGKTAYQQYMDQMMIEQSKSGDLDTLGKWPDKARTESKKFLSKFAGDKRYTEASKSEMALWASDQENKYYKEAALESIRLIGENERRALPATLEFYANDDDKAGFSGYLDEMSKQLLPAEKDQQLALFDQRVAITDVDRILDVEDYDYARRYVNQSLSHIPDEDFKQMLDDHIDASEAAKARKNASVLKLKREETYSTLLADHWDGVLASPQVITDALRQGLITPEAARTLRNEMLTKARPTESNFEDMAAVEEALLDLRSNIGDVGDVLNTITLHAGGLSSTDGRAYVKEAFATQVSADSSWDTEANSYIEQQILNVATMTGIMYGSGEQKAMVAQAKVKYSEAKKAAIRDGKPLHGEELLALAHKVMLPFRTKAKPLIEGGTIPSEIELEKDKRRLSGNIFGIDRTALGMSHTKEQMGRKPKSKEEFESNFRSIEDASVRKAYYAKWAKEVYK